VHQRDCLLVCAGAECRLSAFLSRDACGAVQMKWGHAALTVAFHGRSSSRPAMAALDCGVRAVPLIISMQGCDKMHRLPNAVCLHVFLVNLHPFASIYLRA